MKLIKKDYIKHIILVIIILLILIPIKHMTQSHAEETNYSLDAILYDSIQYSGTGTTLTEAGAEVTGWQYNTSKYLQINPQVPADGKTYVVTVILPQEMYVVASNITAPSGYSDVEFTKNESISVNGGTATYGLNDKSGTIKYTMNYMGVSGTIQLELRYDNVLWDKQASSSITPSGVFPIKVKLTQIDGETETDLKTISISRITSKSKMGYEGAIYYSIKGNSANYTNAIEVQAEKQVHASWSYTSSTYSENFFYPELKFIINVPTYTDSSNNKYYLEIDESSIKYSSMLSAVSPTIEKSNGTYTINFENAYFKPGTIIQFDYKPLSSELKANDQNSYVFKAGSINLYANGKNGNNNIKIHSYSLYQVTYIKETNENVTLTVGNKGVSIVERPVGAVSEFGGFYLENKGTGDSGAKHIKLEFDTGNTNRIKVTTINTFADKIQQYIELTYTLVDDDGNLIYFDEDGNVVPEGTEGATAECKYLIKNTYYNNTTTTNNLKNMFTRSMLPENQRGYYFKTLEYTIESIKASHRLYAYQSTAALTGAGNFFGYVSDTVSASQTAVSRITVTSANESISTKTSTSTTTMQASSNPTYTVNYATLSKKSIQAGESVNVSGRIEGVSYPYGNSTWIKGIRLALILPSDVTINEQSITFKTASGATINGNTVSNRPIEGSGNNLWIIKLPEDICIGYATEKLGVLSGGLYVTFDMQLDTAYTMNNATLFAKDMLVAAGYKQTNGAGGSYSWAKKTDKYDINENGNTSDNVAGVNSTNTSSCQITSQTAMLDIESNISVTTGGVTVNETANAIMKTADDIITYNLNVNIESGGHVDEFSYYMPIPKTSSNVDEFLIKSSSTNRFDMELIEEAAVTGSDLFTIMYTFEENLTYNSAQNLETWYTQEEIENDENLKFENVTMIKLIKKVDVIQNGDRSKISLKMKYKGDTFFEETGMQNVWCSGGYYTHISGSRETAGNYQSSETSVKIEYTKENEDITLTAAKNEMPQALGNVNTVNIDQNLFPNFKNKHTFSISSIDYYNVTLTTKAYIDANKDMAGTDANKTFNITVSVNGSNEFDIVDSNKDILFGSSTEESAPQFTFKVHNTDRLSDNSTLRYIIVTIKSDNGITYKQKIIINREVEKASDPKSAIVGGKIYTTFDETTDSITISKDSAFTAQFVTNYIPNVYKNHIISFSEALPSGTNLIVANVTDENNPRYYYYIANGSTTAINFSDLIKMGTTGTKDYEYYTGADTVEEKLLMIIDFSNLSSGYLTNGSYTMKMIMQSDTVEEYSSKELTYTTTDKRSFSISSNSTAKFGEDYSLTYTISSQVGEESKYEGRKVSIVVTMPNSIPNDTCLNINGTKYYLKNGKQFIVPLGDIAAKSDTITMKFTSNELPLNGENYSTKVALWVSATANGTKPNLGEKISEKTITLTAESKPQSALKITKMSTRIIRRNTLSEDITLTFNYKKISGCTETIELMQKIGNGYQKVTDKLNKVGNVTTHNMGVFSINPTQGTNNLTLRLSTGTQAGTYRFMLRVNDSSGNEILQVPYNFVIIE